MTSYSPELESENKLVGTGNDRVEQPSPGHST